MNHPIYSRCPSKWRTIIEPPPRISENLRAQCVFIYMTQKTFIVEQSLGGSFIVKTGHPLRSASRQVNPPTPVTFIVKPRGGGGFGAPVGNQDTAQNLHLGAKIGPRPPNLEPRWAKDLQFAAKMAPNRSTTASWTDAHRFWTALWQICYRF